MRPGFAINRWRIRLLTLPLLLVLASSSDAKYLIYLKGGHFIVADGCNFSTNQWVGKLCETDVESIPVEDCTREKKPREGRIYWCAINEDSGEVNADDVYDILGTKSHPPIDPLRATMSLEDYLITNRGQGFVNSKDVPKEEGPNVSGRKRDELMKVNRRGVTGIDPEGLESLARAEGLCPGEPAEFSVTEMELYGDFLNFHLKNLLPNEWKPTFYLWVREQVQEKWKDRRRSLNIEIDLLPPDGDAPVSVRVEDQQLLGLLRHALNPDVPDPKLQVCARKVRTATTGATAEKPPTVQSPR